MDFFNRDLSVPTAHDNRVIDWDLYDEPEDDDWSWLTKLEILLGVVSVGLIGVVVLEKELF